MQLHRLEMTAIGPYAAHEVIDFARLGRTGLFLLEGPTGSGKSTIIDAITFALYGKVAQSTADPERIRSHHARPDETPRVRLVFETHSGIYRVERTPRFERPKRRGEGMTPQQPTVKLWRLATVDDLDGGDLLSTNLGDCDDEITRAVGLTREQFVQTVILPQGEFASFLRAKSEDKGKLLEKVFGTDFFRRVQDQIAEAGATARTRRVDAVEQIRGLVHTLAGSAGLDEEGSARLAGVASADTAGLQAQLDAVLDELALNERRAGRASKVAYEQRAHADQQVAATELRVTRRDRLRELQQTQHELSRQRPQIEALEEELRRADQAQPVAAVDRGLALALRGLAAADTRLEEASGAVEAHLRDRGVAALREAGATLRETVGGLTTALELEAGLAEAVARIESRRVSLTALADQRAAVGAEQASLPARLREHEAALAAAERMHALLDSRTASAKLAGERLDSAVEHASTLRLEGETRAAAADALRAAREGEVSLVAMRQSRIDGLAGELGLELVEGEPCVVCGSTVHPLPARPSAEAVTAEQVDEHDRVVTGLRAEAERLAREAAACHSRVRELAARAHETSVDDARVAAERAAADLAESHAAGAEVVRQSRAVEVMRARAEALNAEDTRLAGDIAACEQAIAELVERHTGDLVSVKAARQGHESVAARRAALVRETRAVEALAQARDDHDSAASRLRDQQQQFDDALAACGFTDRGQWASAHRPAEWCVKAKDDITTFHTGCTAVQAGLEAPELADVQLDALFEDLDQLKVVARAARDQSERLAREHGGLQKRLSECRINVRRIVGAVKRHEALIAETADAVRVAALVTGNGDNQLKLDLTNYVLIRRFTEVLAAANVELSRFSGGRYSLEHTDAKDGNRKSGLGVRVHDQHTNQLRDVGTLSGGETFYVSLSLALALAEVVRGESGGVDLGTLFVDEGFGTLDADVLDDVMFTLERLRDDGRTVGIVSHVTELKSRIADRIEIVVKPDHTSTLKITA